jgi:hypothetical protein
MKPRRVLHEGLYSQVKRAPKAKIKRKTFETAGPAVKGAMSVDERCARGGDAHFGVPVCSPLLLGGLLDMSSNKQKQVCADVEADATDVWPSVMATRTMHAPAVRLHSDLQPRLLRNLCTTVVHCASPQKNELLGQQSDEAADWHPNKCTVAPRAAS